MAVRRWRNYLQGHKFIIRTDQQALRHLLDQKTMNPIQQKWLLKLLGLQYEIQYKMGAENKVADALSRSPKFEDSCESITTVTPLWVQRVIRSYQSDAFTSKILTTKAVDKTAYGDFSITEGILRYKGRVVVGNDADLRSAILTEIHNTTYGGHSGVQGTYIRLKSSFYWPGMKAAITKLVQECDTCQKNKSGSGGLPGLLQPLPIPHTA